MPISDTTYNKLSDQSDWLSTMTELGIDVDSEYSEVIAAGKRLDALHAHADRFEREGVDLERLADQLAHDPGDYDTTASAVLMAAMSRSESVREKVAEVFTRAETGAAGVYLSRFRAMAGTTLKLLAVRYADLVVNQAQENALPIGIQSLDTATRAGLAQQYLALEDVERAHRAIAGLLGEMTKAKVLTAGIGYRNPTAADGVPLPKAGAGGVHLAAAIAAGADPGVIEGEDWKALQRSHRAQNQVEQRRYLRAKAGEAAREQAEQKHGRPTHADRVKAG